MSDDSSSSKPTAPDSEGAVSSSDAPLTEATPGNPDPEPQSASKPTPFGPDEWGQASRAFALTFLIGMALVVFVRFGLNADWIHDFLRKNTLTMDERMSFIYQMLAAGSLLSTAGLAFLLKDKSIAPRAPVWEGWAWFLSPLMLLPAVPVVLRHSVWQGHHEELLAVILFGAIIGETLVSQAARHVPPAVTSFARYMLADEQPEPSSRIARFLTEHRVLILVVSCALFYGAFMSFYTIRWHHKLGTATFDLGINNNLLYGGLEGRFNQSPVIFPEDPQKYLANHVKIGLYSLLPLYALYPRAETLLAVQSISLGLGAIPLFLFVRRRLPEWWAAAIALCYLAYYPMHGANFYEMKIVPTSAALVLFCIWAIDTRRWVWGGVLFVWALIMREDMPIPLAIVGAVFLLSGHRPRAGAIMAGVASAWFIFIRFRFMNEVGAWWFPNMYEDLWAEPEKGFQGVIKTLLSNPTYTLKHIFVEKKFWYLMHLLVPLAFIPVRRWYAWAALVPGAILTLLVTDYAPPILFSFQYTMHWAPYLFIATGLVLASMRKSEEGRTRAIGALSMMCLASAGLSYNYGAFPARDKALESGYHKIEFSMSDKERATYEDVKRLVASIPPKASVGSTERIGAHLSSRSLFYTLRRGSHGVEYMVARKQALRLDRTKQTIYEGLQSGTYGVQARFGEFIVFRKGADTKDNEGVIREWRLDSERSRTSRKEREGLRDSTRLQEGDQGKEDENDDSETEEVEDEADEVDQSDSPGE